MYIYMPVEQGFQNALPFDAVDTEYAIGIKSTEIGGSVKYVFSTSFLSIGAE